MHLLEPGLRTLELYLIGVCLLAAIRSVKLRDFSAERSLCWADHGAWLLVSTAIAAAAALLPGLGIVAALLAAFLLVGLWIDALLFRVFTIELGPGGVGGIVVAVLYRELAEMACARRFFRENRAYALLPAAVLLLVTRPFLPYGSGADLVLASLLVGYAVVLCANARPIVLPARGRGTLADFLFARPLPEGIGFVPRPEHAPLLALGPYRPGPSALHGRLRGASVLLITIESLGQQHLASAQTPFLESLLPRAVRSRHHFCVSPTTNNAHVALYASRYLEAPGTSGVAALQRAGLRTVYLSPVRTARYGLRALLERSGFDTVLDEADGSLVSDYALFEQGPRLLRHAIAPGTPFFAHIHTANTHVPYRVVDAARFSRHDPASDRGRFLNAVEEADFVLGELFAGLAAARLLENTLIVVSADHGQSFGELGYRSHGSAVTREQVNVPFVLLHPALPPGELSYSTHFDVLPTVLDLLGLEAPEGFGAPVFEKDRVPRLLLWAGRPSRTSTSNFGLLLPEKKLMLDLVLGRCLEMGWDDEDARELDGDERRYVQALSAEVFRRQGLK
jgi:hypothetical protein